MPYQSSLNFATEWLPSTRPLYPRGEDLGTHWVGPRAGSDARRKGKSRLSRLLSEVNKHQDQRRNVTNAFGKDAGPPLHSYGSYTKLLNLQGKSFEIKNSKICVIFHSFWCLSALYFICIIISEVAMEFYTIFTKDT